jgi:hypothetical protein
MKMRVARVLMAVASISALTVGCSTVMEAERPSATNLSQFGTGERRVDVVARIGAPTGKVDDGGLSCDIYKLHTKGTNAAGKTGIIVTEAAADVFTLGLAEVVLTPAQAASRAGLHTVLFCYNAGETLQQIKDSGVERPLASKHT